MNAADRNTELALERTTLAWIRTGLSMMGLGFVVARFGLFLREIEKVRGVQMNPHALSLWAGVSLVILGVTTLAVASQRHVRMLREIRTGESKPTMENAAVWVSVALAAVGAGMAAYLVATYR